MCAFPEFSTRSAPPRRWGIYGYANAGKSTFLSAMHQPLLVIDPDGRFSEVAGRCRAPRSLSTNPREHRDPLAIHRILSSNDCSEFATVALDSITAILEPLKAVIMEENTRGLHKNKSAPWSRKAAVLRMIVDSMVGCGRDMALIWHSEDSSDAYGKRQTRQTLQKVEARRILRCLNAVIRLEHVGGRRLARVTWSRNGVQGVAIEDTDGYWRGVPERIERALYGETATNTGTTPPVFRTTSQ